MTTGNSSEKQMVLFPFPFPALGCCHPIQAQHFSLHRKREITRDSISEGATSYFNSKALLQNI